MKHPPLSAYLIVFAILMGLLVLTVAFAYVDLGPMNLVIMLTIAVVKAVLVLLYFMHVRYGAHLTWAFAAGGFAWLAIMLVLTLSDYFTRGWL